MSCRYDIPDRCLRGYLKRNAGNKCRYYKKMKLYLCGRISGDENYREKFRKAAASLEAAGYEVCNPAEHGSPDISWADNMKRVLPLMIGCDGLAITEDWYASRGAGIEVRLAGDLEMPVMRVDRWLVKPISTGFTGL
jgi:hypothetical protein